MPAVLIVGAGPTGLVLALWPYPFILVHPQDKHERLLIDELRALGVIVERQTELRDLEQLESSVRATLRRPDGTDEVCEAAFPAGCDGASSTVRRELAHPQSGGRTGG